MPEPVSFPLELTLWAWGFVVVWLVWVNLPWLTPARLTLLGRGNPASFARRALEWLWRWPAVPVAGWWLDRSLTNRPHDAYAQWDFWLLLLIMSAVMSLPGVIVFYARR